jgi:glycosyltransferase involved in cell wall biosynthesis
MHYFPNDDAAQFLVRDVLPLLRNHLGERFEVRLVGDAPPWIENCAREPNVTVTGYVDDLSTELTRADVSIVPLRHGSGTRLKILEAFSSGIPVVSTSIGASGIDARDGQHLLIADDAATFAGACARLVHDDALRTSLTDAAYDLVAQRYDWTVIGEEIASVVEETIDGSRTTT